MKQINAVLTPAQWQAVKDELKSEYNFALTRDVDSQSKDGVTVRWNYDGAKALSVTVTSGFLEAFFAGEVASKIQGIIDAVMA